MSSRNIESILLEHRTFPPSAELTSRARLKPADLEALHRRASEDHVGFWADLAREELVWHKPFTVALDDSQAPNYGWFIDGQLNVSYNCIDVHLKDRADATALIFEGEPGDTRKLTFRELHGEVCRFANALKVQGIERGDRVVIYMPLVPEAVIAMHACARIGAIHSVVFGGFSALSLKDRIEDASAKVLVTADGGWRGGNVVNLKAAADKALTEGCPSIEKVIVYRRIGEPVHMDPVRDIWWHDAIEGQSPDCEPEWVDAEHPLFLLYTSGSTGKPKGIQHCSAGYLLGVKATTKWVLDVQPTDVFWCTADVGWVTGHSYVAYGPLAVGATVVLYEGGPMFPDGGRFWQICQSHGVTVFYTAPTAIRALMKLGDELPARYDLSRLRLLGSVGEPINPEAWMWYHRVIGGESCPIVDTWWQTETGAIMIAPVPGVTHAKPGSCTRPLPGVVADVVDDNGDAVTRPDVGGYLVIRKPWPSMLRTIWGDNDRYIRTYWEKFQNRYYVAGDSAHRDADGCFWIMGRIDDVLNVAGHRLGTMEIESALVAHPRVAEAAVVGKPHDIKGEAVFAYVVCRGARPTGDIGGLIQELRDWVGEQLGAIAKPDDIRFTDNLPKTRSGKIMRRLLRSVARGEEISQDVSTLENPAILEQLRGSDTSSAELSSDAQINGSSTSDKAQRKPKRKAPASSGKAAQNGKAQNGKSVSSRKSAGTSKTAAKSKLAANGKGSPAGRSSKSAVAASSRGNASVASKPAAKKASAVKRTGNGSPVSKPVATRPVSVKSKQGLKVVAGKSSGARKTKDAPASKPGARGKAVAATSTPRSGKTARASAARTGVRAALSRATAPLRKAASKAKRVIRAATRAKVVSSTPRAKRSR